MKKYKEAKLNFLNLLMAKNIFMLIFHTRSVINVTVNLFLTKHLCVKQIQWNTQAILLQSLSGFH